MECRMIDQTTPEISLMEQIGSDEGAGLKHMCLRKRKLFWMLRRQTGSTIRDCGLS